MGHGVAVRIAIVALEEIEDGLMRGRVQDAAMRLALLFICQIGIGLVGWARAKLFSKVVEQDGDDLVGVGG